MKKLTQTLNEQLKNKPFFYDEEYNSIHSSEDRDLFIQFHDKKYWLSVNGQSEYFTTEHNLIKRIVELFQLVKCCLN